jgi:hypothetical protein
MDEGGGLKGLAGGFAGHPGGGQVAQFLIYEREQLLGSLPLAGVERLQNPGNFTHPPAPLPETPDQQKAKNPESKRMLLPFFAGSGKRQTCCERDTTLQL